MSGKLRDERFSRERDYLLDSLGKIVKEVHLCISCPGSCKQWEFQMALCLIFYLDQALCFGLHRPLKGYWPVVAPILPKSTLTFLNQLSPMATNLGKGRAWLLLSLNEGNLEGFLATLEARPSLLSKHYQSHAILLNPSALHILTTLVSGLEHVGFDFVIDVVFLSEHIVEPSLMRLIHEYNSSAQADPSAQSTIELAAAQPVQEASLTLFEEKAELRIMNSPLVKRRSHLRSVLQDTSKHRVSFHETTVDKEKKERLFIKPSTNLQRHRSEWALTNDVATKAIHLNTSQQRQYQHLRRYRSELFLHRPCATTTPVQTTLSPDTERGVPEGQEDPQLRQSLVNVSYLHGHYVSPTEEALLLLGEHVRSGWKVASSTPTKPVPSRAERRRWLAQAAQKWAQPFGIDLPAPSVENDRLCWDAATAAAAAAAVDADLRWRAQPPLGDADSSARELVVALGLDADDRYKSFACCVEFYVGRPRPTCLLLGSKALHVTLTQSRSLLWSAALFDIEQITVTCNYSVLTIRSKVGQLVLEFRDADVLRNAASCLDIAIGRQQRHDAGVQRPVIAVEAPCQLHDHWRPWVFRQTGESECQIRFLSTVYYNESFFTTTCNGDSVLGPYKEGHLMYRWSSAKYRTWHVGYFILKAGVLYVFQQQSDKVPTHLLPLGGDECRGYGRNFHSSRPHTIEIQFDELKCLHLAAASEEESVEWLSVLAQCDLMGCNPLDVDQRFEDDDEGALELKPPLACGLIVTGRHLILFQWSEHGSEHDRAECVAWTPLDSVPIVLISPDYQRRAFCVIEFECREASEGTGDWILMFESLAIAEDFANATARPQRPLDCRTASLLRNKLVLTERALTES